LYIILGFIGSPLSTRITFGDGCDCELVSVECLDAIRCIPSDEETALQNVHSGIVWRQALKKTATYWDVPLIDYYEWAPLGKTLQSISVRVWRQWLRTNELPNGKVSKPEDFVNATVYPFCEQNHLQGRPCFLDKFGEPEQYGYLEKEAIQKYGGAESRASALAATERELKAMRENPYDMSPNNYLMGFAHMARITFHLRRHMLDIYKQRLRTIEATAGGPGSKILRVALHVRRGDACGHTLKNRRYATLASPLNSSAQLSGIRKCYRTAVYMRALKEVQSLAPDRQLVVYVATDHMLSLLDDIKESHHEMYESITWKHAEYPRQLFNYSTGLGGGSKYIEWAPNKAELGETAMVDLWHLSHGQVFVGHLGSRFGKLSWWQATARHNSLIPFFSGDGHSVCCDIDEACGNVSAAILSMENCLTFSREDNPHYEHDPAGYWKNGATMRFQAAADEALTRKKRSPN
jgi:hypothetical protein